MARLGKSFLCNHEELSSIPQGPNKKKPGMRGQTWNPRADEMETS